MTPNRPLEIPEFSERNYATLDDYADLPPADEDTVRILRDRSIARHPSNRRQESSKVDDGARLTGPDAHRGKAVEEIRSRLTQAILESVSARGWMAAIGYHTDTRDALSDAVAALLHVQGLIEIHEQ